VNCQHRARGDVDDILGENRTVRLTVVLSYLKSIPISSIASIIILRPSRRLLKMMTRHSSFSFFDIPSLV